jgi:asparagine N-glycosylation enzyme membrane subunit Stt3
MIEPLINIYYINLYGHYRNEYEPVYESNTIKKYRLKDIFIYMFYNIFFGKTVREAE